VSQRDGFSTGFIAGTIVGGVLGGAIGALLATQRSSEQAADPDRRNANLASSNNRRSRRQFKAASEQSIEIARRSLEDKIAQLNETIDEVRLTLGQVNGGQVGESERVPHREEDIAP
jgi:gas vesicle protein